MRICAFVNYVCHYKVVHWRSVLIQQSLEGLKVWIQSIWDIVKIGFGFPKPWAFFFLILEIALCDLRLSESTPEQNIHLTSNLMRFP